MKRRNKPPEPVDGAVFSTEELALRWDMNPQTLVNWRHQQRGPEWIKVRRPGKRPAVRYRLADVEAYEKKEAEATA